MQPSYDYYSAPNERQFGREQFQSDPRSAYYRENIMERFPQADADFDRNVYDRPNSNPKAEADYQDGRGQIDMQVQSTEEVQRAAGVPTVTNKHTTEIEKRLYPIKPRERVFDEWAAMMLHLDEVDKLTNIREKEVLRQRRDQYKKELDEQMRNKRVKKTLEGDLQPSDGDEYMRRLDVNNTQKQQQVKAQAINIMDENLRARTRALQQVRDEQRRQDEDVVENMRRNDEEERRRKEMEKQNKLRVMRDLQMSYDAQQALKKHEDDKIREMEKKYLEDYKNKLIHDAKDHERNLDLMREKQKQTDMRARNYKLAIQPRQDEQERMDEENAYRAMLEKERLDAERDKQNRNARLQSLASVREQWQQQLELKRRQGELKRQEDGDYANSLRKTMEDQADFEKRKREQEQLERQRYKEALEQQIEDSNKRRIYYDVMSEHERKVNNLDLAAYENMQADLLGAKLVGVKDYKTVSSTPYTNRSALKSPQNETSQPKVEYKNTVLRDGLNRPYCERLLGPTLQNMMDPRVVFMRNDTNNLAYGYKKGGGRDKYFSPLYSKAEAMEKIASTETPLRSSGKAQLGSYKDIRPALAQDYYNSMDIPRDAYEGEDDKLMS